MSVAETPGPAVSMTSTPLEILPRGFIGRGRSESSKKTQMEPFIAKNANSPLVKCVLPLSTPASRRVRIETNPFCLISLP